MLIILVAVLVCGLSFGASELLMYLYPEICWTPRIGGSLVGISVFLQGYVFANPDKFQRPLKSEIILEQSVMHVVYFAALFGTYLWSWGDLLPPIFSAGSTACLK